MNQLPSPPLPCRRERLPRLRDFRRLTLAFLFLVGLWGTESANAYTSPDTNYRVRFKFTMRGILTNGGARQTVGGRLTGWKRTYSNGNSDKAERDSGNFRSSPGTRKRERNVKGYYPVVLVVNGNKKESYVKITRTRISFATYGKARFTRPIRQGLSGRQKFRAKGTLNYENTNFQ